MTMSWLRRLGYVVGNSLAFVGLGFVAGALCGILTTAAPTWLMALLGAFPLSLVGAPLFVVVALVGGAVGAVLGPIFGWVLMGRVQRWRSVFEPAAVGVAAVWLSVLLRVVRILPNANATDVTFVAAVSGSVLGPARLLYIKRRQLTVS